MSVWIMKPALPEAEVAALVQGDTLPLPYAGLPELKGMASEADMRKLLSALSPDAPLETINRQAEIHWRNLSELRTEDLILLPLPGGKQVALAQALEPYLYRCEEGRDIHEMRVRWVNPAISALRLRNVMPLIKRAGVMQPVESAEDRKLVYRFLDAPFNRFAKWHWILAVFFVLQMITMLIGQLRQ